MFRIIFTKKPSGLMLKIRLQNVFREGRSNRVLQDSYVTVFLYFYIGKKGNAANKDKIMYFFNRKI